MNMWTQNNQAKMAHHNGFLSEQYIQNDLT